MPLARKPKANYRGPRRGVACAVQPASGRLLNVVILPTLIRRSSIWHGALVLRLREGQILGQSGFGGYPIGGEDRTGMIDGLPVPGCGGRMTVFGPSLHFMPGGV
jgi:hypothetical protein